jgi:16S rRNA C967 or C1407 C5-methylase (RsmB/RsmF family)
VAALLSCALALMTAPDAVAPYEEFTVVDQTVTAAEAHPDTARAKGMVNAVLRRFLRERKPCWSALLQPVAQWNYPQWWIDAARTAWPRLAGHAGRQWRATADPAHQCPQDQHGTISASAAAAGMAASARSARTPCGWKSRSACI